ncbi:MAG: hypothetical protein K2I46_02980 [Clostridia bacterium]|nr:hypothetical protein [Clostridia bacterium]
MELTQDEEMLVRCAPQKASFVLSKSVAIMPFALIWLCFDGFAISMIAKAGMPTSMRIVMVIFFAFHLLPVWLWIFSIIKALRVHKNLEYALTNERIIVRDKDKLLSYYYKDLCKVQVRVGFIDKMFKVGDIVITRKTPTYENGYSYNNINRFVVTLLDLANPRAVGDKLQEFIDSETSKFDQSNRQDGAEYESYYETDNNSKFTKKYDCNNTSKYYNDKNDYEKDSIRYTSKKKSEPTQKTEEDDYLDNIMDSINKKDEF